METKIIKAVFGGTWSILDSIGGRVTHRSEKTDDGVVIVEVTEQ